MSKLTKSAKGRDCTIQIYPYCNMNSETTVFCHAPSEDKGMSRKSPDWWGAYGCSTCHDIVDGRMKADLTQEDIFRCHVRGIFRTQKAMIEEGLIGI